MTRRTDIDLASLGAGETAGLVRSGRVTAVETVRAALERIDRADPRLRAFTEVWPESALSSAAAIDRAARRGEDLPLAGVPLAVKASEGISSLQAERLIAAGAVPVGATSIPGPGTAWRTWGDTPRGRTVNPWCSDLSPGGSSAGSAVAVAAGLVPMATASDGAGSTRIPAAWCGVVGYKPTNGLLPARDRARLNSGGPITRSSADADLYRRVVLGGPAVKAPVTTLRVGWSADLGFADTDPAIARVARDRLRVWEERVPGVEVVDVALALPDPVSSWSARRSGDASARHGGRYDPSALEALLSEVDLLATPTTPNPPHGHEGPGDTMSVALTWAFNLTGHPALSLPAGFDRNGAPVGVQLVSDHRRDGDLLAAARTFEGVGALFSAPPADD
ncbi:amidase [Nocardiopsis alba]|uniref:amidase n=1 Tax=Nocardiopsis alba TaxID=53437 RepID=UPI00367177DE